MKIIIIGAGIAGLTLAKACQKAGFEVKIYEKAKKLSNIGGGILIWPHGMRCLQQLGLADSLSPFKTTIQSCNIYNVLGEKIFNENCSLLSQAIGGDIFPIDRSLLQTTLVESLPKNLISLNKNCVSIIHHAESAQVIFEDGTEDSADLIVGADGIYSRVGQYVAEKNSPIYTDHCWWGGIIDRKYIPHYSPYETHTILGQGKLCIVWPTYDDKLIWYVSVKMPATDLIRDKDDNGMKQLKSICRDWNDDVNKIISAPVTHKNFHLSIYALPPRKRWSHDRVTLIGDAAHAMGPILAQGASLAIEDGFILSQCLENFGSDVSKAIHHFENSRHTIYQQIFDLENQATNIMITDDLQALEQLQQQLPHLNLLIFYQDLIPLVNENASVSTKILKNKELTS